MKKRLCASLFLLIFLSTSTLAADFYFGGARGEYRRAGCGINGDPGEPDIPCINAVGGGKYTVSVLVQNEGSDGGMRVEAMIKKRHEINSFFLGIKPFPGYTLDSQVSTVANCNPSETDVVTKLLQLPSGGEKVLVYTLPVPDIQQGDEDSYGIFLQTYQNCWKDLTPEQQNSNNPIGQVDYIAFPLHIIAKQDYLSMLRPNQGGGGGNDQSTQPQCNNGVQDGSESYVDCGGNCAPCVDNSVCNFDADCKSGNCVLHTYQNPQANFASCQPKGSSIPFKYPDNKNDQVPPELQGGDVKWEYVNQTHIKGTAKSGASAIIQNPCLASIPLLCPKNFLCGGPPNQEELCKSVLCQIGFGAQPDPTYCSGSDIPNRDKLCGNGKIDKGETCMNCPQDAQCEPLPDPQGKKSNTIIFLLLIAIIFLVFNMGGKK